MVFRRILKSRTIRLSFFATLFCFTFIVQTLAQTNLQLLRAPLAFEPNLGQSDTSARYVVQGLGYDLSLRPDEARIRIGDDSIQIKIRGARSDAAGLGSDKLASYTNYLVGDRSKWLPGIPHYGKVRFEQIFDGIDIVYYGTDGKLEYDFIVAPGVAPSILQLSFEGARNLRLTDGNLQIGTLAGDLEMGKPTVYQDIDGERRIVESSYSLRDNLIRFQIATYDATRPLIIDPTLTFTVPDVSPSTSAMAEAVAIRTVTGGNEVFIAGTVRTSNTSAYVAKFDTAGARVYNTVLGGNGADSGLALAVADDGKAFLAGLTRSTDWPTTAFANLTDGYLVKLEADGTVGANSAIRIGGLLDDRLDSVVVVPVGANYDVHVAGAMKSLMTSITQPPLSFIPGSWNGFVAEINPTNLAMTQGTYIGPIEVPLTDTDFTRAIALKATQSDSVTEMYLAGTTIADLACPSPCTANIRGARNAFVAKVIDGVYNTGSYVTYVSGTNVQGTSVAVSEGLAYLGGTKEATFSLSCPAAVAAHPGGFADAFVVKLGVNGAPGTCVSIGGNNNDKGNDVSIQGTGVVLTGDTQAPSGTSPGREFPVLDAGQALRGGGQDAFLAQFDSNLALVSSTFVSGVGSSLTDAGRSVAATSDKVYAAGHNRLGAGAFKPFIARLEEGLSIDDFTIDRCVTPNPPCLVLPGDLNTQIATATITLTAALGPTDLLQLKDGEIYVTFGPKVLTPGTDGKVYTFPIILKHVPNVGVHGANVHAELNGVPTTSLQMLFSGPSQLTGVTFSANPAPADSSLNITVSLDPDPTEGRSIRIEKHAPSGGLLSGVDFLSVDPSVKTIPPGATSVVFAASTSTPPSQVAVRIKAFLVHSDGQDLGFQETPANSPLRINPALFSVDLTSTVLNPVTGGNSFAGNTVSLDCQQGTPTINQTVNLSASPAAGITFAPSSVVIPAGSCISGSFTVKTANVGTATDVTVTATLVNSGGQTLHQKTAPFRINPLQVTLSLSPTSLKGGFASTGTITLDAPATGPINVGISVNDTQFVSFPSSVLVAADASSATFTIDTHVVPATNQRMFTASLPGSLGGDASDLRTLTINPYVLTLSLNPTEVTAGQQSTGTVTLDSAVPSGGATVSLASSHPNVTVPATATIVGGANSTTFTVNTAGVTANTTADITATLGVSDTKTLTVRVPITTTTTTISAPTVTYNANGAVTVSVTASEPVTGDVTLIVDGGAPLTQPLSGGSTTFIITSPNAGDHSLVAAFAAQGTFLPSSATGALTVNKADSTATVTCAPGPFVYNGSPKTPCTATVTGAGGLSQSLPVTYSNNTNAGTATASASFAGNTNHNASSDSETFVIDQATPIVSWSNPADIRVGTPLSSTQLNATASTAGTFVYTPPAGTILDVGDGQILSVSFTPDDTVNYNYPAPVNVTINVKPAGPTVVPFSAFTVDVEIHLHRGDDNDNFRVDGDLTLGAQTNGINPSLEPVTLQIDDYTLFIPAGSFKRRGDRDDDGDDDRRKPKEVWHFIGKIGDDRVHIRIRGFGDNEYDIRATGRRTDMTGVVDGTPIDVTLAIGDDNGTATDSNPKIHPRIFAIKDADLTPRVVFGGNPSTGTVTLQCSYGVSLDVPVTVTLTAESGTGVSVPPTVTIPPGSSCSTTFPVTTSVVSRHVSATITARVGESRESATLSVYPVVLKDLALNPKSVKGGNPSTGTVAVECDNSLTLGAAVTVSLTAESGTGVSVPSTVTIPAGSCSRTFTVTTTPVSKQKSARITATVGSSTEYETLTIKK